MKTLIALFVVILTTSVSKGAPSGNKQHGHGMVKRDMDGLGSMLKSLGGGDGGGIADAMKNLGGGAGGGGVADLMKNLGGGAGGGKEGGMAGIMGMVKNVMGGKDFGEVLKGMTGGKGGGLDFSKIFSAFGGGGKSRRRRREAVGIIDKLRAFGGGRGGKIGSNGRIIEVDQNILGGKEIKDFLEFYYTKYKSDRGRVIN